jgi:hypothetical protein
LFLKEILKSLPRFFAGFLAATRISYAKKDVPFTRRDLELGSNLSQFLFY